MTIADAIYSTNPSRPVCASGLVSLPTALLLGAALLALRGIKLRWRQLHPNREPQAWSLDAERSHAHVLVERVELDAAADQLAVAASVNHDVEEAIRATPALPAFRGVVRVRSAHGGRVDLADAGQASTSSYACSTRSRPHGPSGEASREHMYSSQLLPDLP